MVEPILSDLLRAASDSDPVVRNHIYTALGTLGPKAAQVAPMLIERLNSILKNEGEEFGSSEQFRRGLTALEKIANVERAAPIVNAGLKAKDKNLRKATIQALSQSNEAAQKAAPGICASLGDPDLGELAAEIVLRIRGRDMVVALANVVDKGPAPARLRAIKLLEAMGPEAKPALGALDRAVHYFPKKEDGKAGARRFARSPRNELECVLRFAQPVAEFARIQV